MRSIAWRVLAVPSALGLALAAAVLCLERPSPLFLNLGAGDEPFARGFRAGWERDGLNQSGETMFRWTEDGARLEFPVVVLAGRLRARMRVARFVDAPAEITLLAGERVVDRWTQRLHGWSVRTADLGEARGPLTLRFRSTSADGEALGIALDWVEVAGAERVLPRSSLLAGLAALLVGVPLGALLVGARRLAVPIAFLLLALAAAALLLDRLGGLVALSTAGAPALAVLLVLGLGFMGLARAWPDLLGDGAWPLGIPLAAALVALVALCHPFFYYPDVDTHARYVAAIRSDAYLAWDPAEFQSRTGSWTREIAGRRVPFPYSPVFHLAAWPFARAFGETTAVKTVAVIALGFTLVLVHAFARALGLPRAGALSGQAVLALVPVTASRLSLALFPTLLGQATDLLLVVHLARRLPHLTGARDAAAAALFLLLAQAAYTGSLLNVAALVGILFAFELAGGDWRRALRLMGAYAIALAVVVAVQYRSFLPVLWRDVIPHATAAAEKAPRAEAGELATLALGRLGPFYDLVYPLLLLPGFVRLRAAPEYARRVTLAVLLAGASLLALRYAAPALFRDAKEVELLAPAVAALSAAGLVRLWGEGRLGRAAAAGAALYAASWGATSAAQLYAARFLAVGR